MKIDVFSSAGTKTGSMDLPSALFEAPVRQGLMHLALLRQQGNRRRAIAHVKHRGEVAGSTRKLFQQKGTGNARRGSIRSPLLRGGGKAFGPRSNANFHRDMPRKMRRAALASCLSLKAKEGAIVGLESYPDTVKTKEFKNLLEKMKLSIGRRIVIVTSKKHRGVELSARNIPRVKTLLASYLNPEDLLNATHVVFMVDAIKATEETFGATSSKKKPIPSSAA
jgi:large subunit ribosomal protein L4